MRFVDDKEGRVELCYGAQYALGHEALGQKVEQPAIARRDNAPVSHLFIAREP